MPDPKLLTPAQVRSIATRALRVARDALHVQHRSAVKREALTVVNDALEKIEET